MAEGPADQVLKEEAWDGDSPSMAREPLHAGDPSGRRPGLAALRSCACCLARGIVCSHRLLCPPLPCAACWASAEADDIRRGNRAAHPSGFAGSGFHRYRHVHAQLVAAPFLQCLRVSRPSMRYGLPPGWGRRSSAFLPQEPSVPCCSLAGHGVRLCHGRSSVVLPSIP